MTRREAEMTRREADHSLLDKGVRGFKAHSG